MQWRAFLQLNMKAARLQERQAGEAMQGMVLVRVREGQSRRLSTSSLPAPPAISVP